jgi:hypothetical protein
MSLDNILRLSYWTDSAITNAPAGPAMWLVALLGVALAVAPIAVPRWRSRRMWPHIAAGALVAIVALGRLFAIPVLGWRLGWLIAGLLSGGAVLMGAARAAWRDGALADAVAAAGFGEPARAVAWRWDVAGLWTAAHGLGMAACFVSMRLPAALGIAAVGLVAGVGILARRGRRGLAALTPFVAAEAMLALRLGLSALTGRAGDALPQPLESLLNVPLTTWVACGLALAAAWRMLARRLALPFARASALALIAGALAWGGWLGSTLATRGVTGSDPYAYAQMGVDLARRGTVTHSFPLVRITYELGIPSEPVTHIGYREPRDIRREAPTVWPPGYAVFTGAAYALLGETGLYAITPALAALALILAGLLGFRLAGGGPRGWAVAGLAVALTATSYQQVEWQLIPMADIASQALSLGALLLALLTPKLGRRGLALAAGALIGFAFDVRYTQVLIAPAIALALWLAADTPRRERLFRVALAAAGALVAALPVLAYHAWAFGGPFTTGSDELQHFSLAGMPGTLASLLTELGWYREFGLIAPLVALGAWAMARDTASRGGAEARRAMPVAVLAAFALPVFVFHLAYAYLRQRDLLSIFPVGTILAAYGAVRLIEALLSQRRDSPPITTRRGWAVFGAVFVLAFGLGYRSIETFQLPITRGFSAFGYLVGPQRASFDTLKAMTPAEAVIACSLNSGAIDLYTGRLTFRPATWTPEQLLRFVEAVRADGKSVYAIDESNELTASLVTLRARYTLTPVGAIDVPYYFMPGGGSENRRVPVYRVE